MFEFFVGKRYLWANSGFASVVTWFSLIGVALGVATLIIVTSVMNGFKEELLSVITGMNGHITITSADHKMIKNYRQIVEKIQKMHHIKNVAATVEGQAVFLGKNGARGVLVYGFYHLLPMIADNIIAGSCNGALIGKKLAEIQFCLPGKHIKLMLPDGKETPIGYMQKEMKIKLSGIFSVGMTDYDKNVVVLPLKEAQDFLNLKDEVNYINVFIENNNNIAQIKYEIKQILGGNFIISDINHSNSALFHAVKVEKNVMSLILSIIVLVAAFNIISSLTMLTNSKIRDIAMLRAMGATKQSICKIFFLVGSTIGAIGTVFGTTFGILISCNIDKMRRFLENLANSKLFDEEIYFLSQLPAKVDFTEVTVITCLAFIL